MYNQASIYKGGGVYKMGEASALPDNYEKPKRYAVVGDNVYADANGNVHILVASTINPSTLPSGWEFVGVVALREGMKATILYKTENTNVKWASMWIFKVNGLKLDGTDTFVLQQGPTTGNTPVVVGTFTASESATDLDTLVSELDTWLRANTTATGALANYNWHAEKHEDADGVDSCFIVVDNISYQSRFSPIKSSTSGATAIMYMWDWCGFNKNVSAISRKDGVDTFAVVCNKDRFKVYNSNVNSPTDSLTSIGIFNEASFDATTIVKGYYGTYDNYLNYMMVDKEATEGAYYEFKGKGLPIQENLSEIVFKNLSGTDTSVFVSEAWTASLKAHSTASVEGLNEGDFFSIPINVLNEVFGKMKVDGSDVVNSSLTKAGATAYPLNVPRWVVGRAREETCWIFTYPGSFNISPMNGDYRAVAVAEIDL